MQEDATQHSWFGPSMLDLAPEVPETTEGSKEFVRQWQGFMTARLTLGIVMLALQIGLYATGSSHSRMLVAISLGYFVSTAASRFLQKPHALGGAFNLSWFTLVGVDVVAFSALQLLQGTTINYTPLFALPILLAAVLGPLRLALGTAASVTVVLLGNTLWTYLSNSVDAAPYFVQGALSGVGYFVIALLANQLATRLATEGQRAKRNQAAANIQRQVNELVIESLPDGVLIIDEKGSVRAANPAARKFLGSSREEDINLLHLQNLPGWMPLWNLTRVCMGTGKGREEDITLRHAGRGPRRVRVRTRLAAIQGAGSESLCVLFLQDLRELEARMRTEKLASMGRMSTAVAHEIRNPLAAISQANALLDEDLPDPHLKRLTAMIDQNAKRLGKIVDDILDAAHVQPRDASQATPNIPLNENVHRICTEWAIQNGAEQRILLHLHAVDCDVQFDPDHLRRVIVNLLDNARRYASQQPEAIQVITGTLNAKLATVIVWSDGAPMEQSVERHLFEPFFSSESRSSGLGLYICRELCAGHGASILYQRNNRATSNIPTDGNEFAMTLMRTKVAAGVTGDSGFDTPWQTTLY